MDMTTAARSVLRNPRFSLLVIFTLTLGIGANVGIFTLLDAVLFRPTAVREPGQVIEVFEALNEQSPRGGLAYVTFQQLAASTEGVDGMAAFATTESELGLDGRSIVVQTALVSGSYFRVLGVVPPRGRAIVDDDVKAWGGDPVAVISHELWRDQFGGRSDILGLTIRLGEATFDVVGVAPPRFRGIHLASTVDVWVPVTMGAAISREEGLYGISEVLTEPFARLFDVVARLSPEVPARQAAARLNVARRSIPHEIADGVSEPISVLPLREAAAVMDREDLLRFLSLLGTVVGLTLIAAGLNVANLLLVRFRRRAQDLAVRSALGAGRGRLLRQLTFEAVLLGLASGTFSLLAARGVIHVLSAFTLPGGLSVAEMGLQLSPMAIGVAGVLGLTTTLAIGGFTAWRATRWEVVGHLRPRMAGEDRRRVWGILLAAQTAISIVLLVGATLFGRTLQEALRTDLGFRADSVAALSVDFRAHGVTGEEVVRTVEAVLDRLEERDDVESAALASHVPVSRRSVALPFVAEGQESVPGGMPINIVTPGYFRLLGIPVVSGRAFDETDRAESPPVIIVNEAAAQLLWPERETPVGQRAGITFSRVPSTVIGVVGQTLYHDLLTRNTPYVYYPLAQLPGPATSDASFLARGDHGHAPALVALRDEVRRTDPDLPIHGGRSVAGQLADILATQRLGAILLTLLGGLALLVAAVGIYGVASWAVASRRREIAVHMALGAPPATVLRSVLGGTGAAMAVGALGGILVALNLSALIESFLYGITPLDAIAFAGAMVILAVIAILAIVPPARQAVLVDPATAMRSE